MDRPTEAEYAAANEIFNLWHSFIIGKAREMPDLTAVANIIHQCRKDSAKQISSVAQE